MVTPPKSSFWSLLGAMESVTAMFGTGPTAPVPLNASDTVGVRGSLLGTSKVSAAAPMAVGENRVVMTQLLAGTGISFSVKPAVQVLAGMVKGAARGSATAMETGGTVGP